MVIEEEETDLMLQQAGEASSSVRLREVENQEYFTNCVCSPAGFEHTVVFILPGTGEQFLCGN